MYRLLYPIRNLCSLLFCMRTGCCSASGAVHMWTDYCTVCVQATALYVYSAGYCTVCVQGTLLQCISCITVCVQPTVQYMYRLLYCIAHSTVLNANRLLFSVCSTTAQSCRGYCNVCVQVNVPHVYRLLYSMYTGYCTEWFQGAVHSVLQNVHRLLYSMCTGCYRSSARDIAHMCTG